MSICNTCKNKPCLIYKMAPLTSIRNGKKCEFFESNQSWRRKMNLKPCPFCGSKYIDESFSRGYFGGDRSRPVIAAGCMNCNACGPDVEITNTENGYNESIQAWNTRSNDKSCKKCGDKLNGHEDESNSFCRWCVTGWTDNKSSEKKDEMP